MSLKRFLQKLWGQIARLFNGMLPELKNVIHIGVLVVEGLKNFIESPATDVLTAIIPGAADDAIKARLRVELPKILVNLKLAENCSHLTDPEEIIACAINVLRNIEGDYRSAYLHSLSIMVAQVAADGRLSWSDGAYILEWYYRSKAKNQIG